jgi:hypothetical protein
MDFLFGATLIAMSLTIDLGGEVMAELLGNYVGDSYEDWLWVAPMPPVAAEPEPSAKMVPVLVDHDGWLAFATGTKP